jgi:hypothetical protein
MFTVDPHPFPTTNGPRIGLLPLKEVPECPVNNLRLTDTFDLRHLFDRLNSLLIDVPGLTLGLPR